MKWSNLFILLLVFLTFSCKEDKKKQEGMGRETINVDEAPFPMSGVKVPRYPDVYFPITDYGARPLPADGRGYPTALDSSRIIHDNIHAFERAMEDCSTAGGGHVVVPKGEWLTGLVVFKSNCDLYLSEGATLVFSDNLEDFLPEMISPWEGIICQNYCPMVYAINCSNIGISGPGTLHPTMDLWRTWIESTPDHVLALQTIYQWGIKDQYLYSRHMSGRNSRLRPPLVQFVQCNNIVLQDFKVRESPFWTIHMYHCDEGVARRLDVVAHDKNNTGIVLEMTRRFVVEDCSFDQEDDAIVIKSGRNHEAWRKDRSSRDIIIRNCTVKNGKVLLGVGTELSGGISNIYMHDCRATGFVDNMFYIKTNRRRGAFVDNVIMERCEATSMKRALAIDTDVLYQWRNIVQTYKDSVTEIKNITMRDIKIGKAIGLIDLNGDKDLPVKNVTVSNIRVDSISSFVSHVSNVEGYKEDSISYNWFGNTGEKIDIPN